MHILYYTILETSEQEISSPKNNKGVTQGILLLFLVVFLFRASIRVFFLNHDLPWNAQKTLILLPYSQLLHA